MIFLYHLITMLLLPLYILVLIWRILRKKENFSRIQERFGIATCKRPVGTLIWLHAASVGESAIAVTLIENISATSHNLNFLVTTGTIASSKTIAGKLPQNAVHQFLPIDNIIFIKKFLKIWQPKLGIFIEAEIWPGLLVEASKACKLLLLNAHISDRSFKRWYKVQSFFQTVMASFSTVATQSIFDYEKYEILGTGNLINLGNIKFANKKLPVDAENLANFKETLSGLRVIVFASTHQSDEKVVLNVVKSVKLEFQNCYFIMIPRHPDRRDEIKKICRNLNLKFTFRSYSKTLNLADDLYIVDNFGELGLFYSLAYISFIGGSFSKGGHNPIEPSHFKNMILFGPDMSNCRAVAEDMLLKKAAIKFNNEHELLEILQNFLKTDGELKSQIYRTNAEIFASQYQQIFQNYLSLIKKYI